MYAVLSLCIYLLLQIIYMPFSVNIHGSTMVRKSIRLVSIGNTIYTYLFIYMSPNYMYIPIFLQYTSMCEVCLNIGTSYYIAGG